MPDEILMTVLLLVDDYPCDFCTGVYQEAALPYKVCQEHYSQLKEAIENDEVPTTEFDV